MLIQYIILISAVIFFALNMGGSGIAPSFASVYGARLISREKAVALFAVFVVLGALAFGSRVAKTLSSGLLPGQFFTPQVALIILGSAAISLFIANALKVPQSTSWVTVFAVFGAALHFNGLNLATTFQMVGLWLVLPLIGFILTFIFFRGIYPPRASNFWFYEKVPCLEKTDPVPGHHLELLRCVRDRRE